MSGPAATDHVWPYGHDLHVAMAFPLFPVPQSLFAALLQAGWFADITESPHPKVSNANTSKVRKEKKAKIGLDVLRLFWKLSL